MSRFNPDPERAVGRIYDAASVWRDRCLNDDDSIFAEGKSLWTAELLDELDRRFVQNPDEGEGDFYAKLKTQLLSGSPACKQLMAELLWILMLFQSDIIPTTKREKIREVWSWSGEDIAKNHPLLEDSALWGIGRAGTAYNVYRWNELASLIYGVRNLKSLISNERQRILGGPWVFAEWLNEFLETKNRQLRHIMPHLLFPDSFERIASERAKRDVVIAFRDVLADYTDASEKEIRKWNLINVDQTLLELRKRLEKKRGWEIDFYQDEFKAIWRQETRKPSPGDTLPPVPPPHPSTAPLNLILYGPPGTGKTHHLRTHYLPRYGDDRFEFVTFHQSYAYEDFVEGIRPETKNDAIAYEVRPGALRRICAKAAEAPDKRFALLIDEINRGNVAKIFGELISLVEIDKRIHTDSSGNRLLDCEGMEVTLPYSGKPFGVPANVDIIGTMNTADRSIALLDSALRRRFRFEELMPQPGLLKSIDGGDGGEIDLRELLEAMNARLSRLLHRDQAIGHSYFYKVESFDDLRSVFSHEIIPLLQEAFYDDWGRMRLVLADQSVEGEEFQLVRSRKQSARQLFPKADSAEIGDGEIFEIAREDEITPDSIRKIYETPE